MRIDVHAHYWAQKYIDALIAAGRRDLAFAGQRDDLASRLAEMDRVGVDVQLFSAIGLNTEVEDPDAAAVACRVINDLYVDIADEYEGRFRGFASVPLPHVAEAIAETDRALDELDLVGIALPCVIGGKGLDEYPEYWEYLGSRGRQVVVYVHPVGADSNCHPGLAQFGLNMLLGSTMQIAMAPLRVALSGITQRYANIQFIFALCGGTLPYLWQRYERNLRRGIEMSAVAAVGKGMFAWMDDLPFDEDEPMELFRQNVHFDTSVQDIPAALRLAKETIGVDRLMLGSDAIFASLTEAVQTIQNDPDLTTDDKHRILDVNAQALLGLPTSGRRATH
ncbi:amidohydrolase family protein [Microbacterium yannicii]|uniref:amidohydrolase family protein n=1 Tax=Microbacterium yannicii TaxID=671622 RepID=UPI00030F648E|nr:amidohydrolase family protein [Microbacterium yannicii]